MSPEWLLESALFLAALFAGAVGVSLLRQGQRARGLQLGAISLAFLALTVGLSMNRKIHTAGGLGSRTPVQQAKPLTPLLPRPASSVDSSTNQLEGTLSTSLLLGSVLVRVAASDRYELSVDKETFLLLEPETRGLFVTCHPVATNDSFGVRFHRNQIGTHEATVKWSTPDPHTLLVTERSEEMLRVRFLEPRKIEVAGRFAVSDSIPPIVITPLGGILWKGGAIPAGSTIDLTPQGKGRLNFESSGLLQILR